MMCRTRNAAALLAAGALTIASSALAVDAKTISGGVCLPLLPAGSTYNPWTQTRVFAVNAHSASLTYVCPMLRDVETSRAGLAQARVSVRVPADAKLSCTLRSNDNFGVRKDSFTTTHVNLDPEAATDSDLSFGAEIDVSVNDGTYAVACSVPPTGRIFSYRWAEN
jgi:hypothetical protein